MLIPIIKVKDRHSGKEHIVGVNSHDALIIENNTISYLNRQCYVGTNSGNSQEDGYDFIGTDYGDGLLSVEMWDIEQVIEYARQESRETLEQRKRIDALAKLLHDEREENYQEVSSLDTHVISGNML